MRDRAILALASLLVGWSAAPAGAVDEVEPNDTIATANLITSQASVDGERLIDDADFFVYTGLVPGESYAATLDNTSLGLGWFAADGSLLDSIAFQGFLELADVVADDNGEIVLGVCGHPDGQSEFDCAPGAIGFGPYTLDLPEPRAPALAGAALATVSLLARRRRRG